ncbi:ABC transporter substrate-binding protein [Pseudonocardia sp. CA-107938]|uniref:ABC transporter substrate-binding protein n=1 Tax=Pseudonocardia sp. CA-107938 TaxID=3240021 RepID=UPI003D90B421
MAGGITRTFRRATAAVLAVLAATAALLVGTAPAHAQQPAPSTLRIAISQDIDSLNPFIAVRLSSTQVGRLMYEYLTTIGPDNTVQPGLAESWQAAPDKVTWTFKIREANWSDGRPITARDVAFTYNLIMTNADAKTANGPVVANFASVAAPDDRTLVIVTKAPQASILNSEIPIVPEHVWASHAGDIKGFTNTETFPAVVSGPFTLAGYQEGQSITLAANDRFWRGRPKIDQLQFVKYENSDAAVQGLIKGDVDLVRDMTPAQFDSLAGNERISRNEGRNRRYTELLVNWSNPNGQTKAAFGDGNPALKDVRVRRALAMAIDVDTIISKVKQGHAEAATGIIPPVYPDWAFTPSDAQKRRYDPEQAKKLLDEAGYRAGPDGKRAGPDGKPLALRLVVATDTATNRQTSEYLVGWFAAVGITLTPEFKSSNQADDDQIAGNFDLAFSGWSVNPDPDTTLAQQTCAYNGSDNSDSGYCNPAYDALYLQQQVEIDHAKRQALVQQMQSLLYDDVAAIVLTNDKLLEAYRNDRFTGFVTQPANGGVITGQTGYWGYYSAVPSTLTPEQGGGMSFGTTIGIVAAVIVVLGVVGFLVVRSGRRGSDDRE